MEPTISPGPVPGVLDGLAVRRDEYATQAAHLAAELVVGPSMDELTQAEEELLAQLADVRRRKTDRAVRESEHRAAQEAAEFFEGLMGRTRSRIEQARRDAGVMVDRPRPDPDPLAGPSGIVRDSREEVARATGGYPTVPSVPPAVPSGPSPVELAGKVRDGLVALSAVPGDATPQDATPSPDVAPGRVVATGGPTMTQPDASAQPEPSPAAPSAQPDQGPPASTPSPASLPQRGPRHKKGGRR